MCGEFDDEADAIPAGMCKHYSCRCARAAELAAMAQAYNRTDLLLDAIGVHRRPVQCRRAAGRHDA